MGVEPFGSIEETLIVVLSNDVLGPFRKSLHRPHQRFYHRKFINAAPELHWWSNVNKL